MMGENLIDNSESRITKSGMPLINRKSFTKKCDRRFAKLLKRPCVLEDGLRVTKLVAGETISGVNSFLVEAKFMSENMTIKLVKRTVLRASVERWGNRVIFSRQASQDGGRGGGNKLRGREGAVNMTEYIVAIDVRQNNTFPGKEPVSFMGGVFAGLLRLDLNEEPLKEWVTRTAEASGIAEEEIDAERSKPDEVPQQIEIE
uniref:Uncharacterized protein n=1 Tax=Fagus sylvatica TaxID=28930 RepID=A0A2N9IQ61_FAGSY